jgi:hypothetical protein
MIKSITAKSPYLADIIQFFKKPGLYFPAKKASFKDFLILVLAKFIFIFPIILLTHYLSGDRFDSNVSDDLDDKPYLLFFAVVILAPMGEELYFRYHQNRKYLSIILTLIVTVLTVIAEYYLCIFYLIYLMILLGSKVLKREIPTPLMVYSVSIFFAFFHLTNYEDVNWWTNFYWAPLLVFSQFIGGIILSFIRMHEGLLKGMLFHGMWNGTFALFIFLPE